MNLFRDFTDRAALDKAYSPSQWVGNFSKTVAEYGTKSRIARDRVGAPRICAYGPSADERLDFFPARVEVMRSPPPTIIYIHGGYWQQTSKDEYSFPAIDLNAIGCNYIAINYGLAPKSGLPQMVERCRHAIAWIWKNSRSLGIDQSEFHLAGCSAGAHLATMAAIASWDLYGLDRSPIRTLTLLSGIFDLRPLLLTYVNGAVRMTVAEAINNSPLLLFDLVQGDFPDTLLVHGSDEPPEFKRQSMELFSTMVRKGARVKLNEIEGRNHFDLIFDLADRDTEFGELFMSHIENAPP